MTFFFTISMVKWSDQLKIAKRKIRDYVICELKGINNYKTKI